MQERYEVISMKDHYKIRLGIFEPKIPVKGVVQLIHGFGEHMGPYLPLIHFLVDSGFICIMHDQRGFGTLAAENPKKRGRAKHYEQFLSDILEIRTIIGKKYANYPVYLFGHSMGGNIALNLLLRETENQSLYQKVILESPWLTLTHPPHVLLQKTAKIIGKISPDIRIHSGFDFDSVAQKPELARTVVNDGIHHDFLSLRLFSELSEAGLFALNTSPNLKIPCLLFCGEKDKVCSPDAMRTFAQNAGKNLNFGEIKEGYHALRLGKSSQEFFEKTRDFLLTD